MLAFPLLSTLIPVSAYRQPLEFDLLKQRLLLKRLDETDHEASRVQLHDAIIRAAAEAASLASQTDFPALFFPALFEEKTATAFQYLARQEEIRRRSWESQAA